jgi:lysophospholipase L1-like esterase
MPRKMTIEKALTGIPRSYLFSLTNSTIADEIYAAPPAPDPTFWLDTRQLGYTDAGKTIVASSAADRVLRIPQGGGLAGDWSAASSGVAPFREPSALWVPDNGGFAPPTVTLSARSCTLAVSGTTLDSVGAPIVGALMGDSGGTLAFGIGFFSGVLYFWYCGGFGVNISTGLIPANGSKFVVVARFTATSVDWKVLVNGSTTTGSSTVTVPAVSVSNVGIGAAITVNEFGTLFNGADIAVSQALGYARVLSDGDRDAVFSELSGYGAMVWPSSAPLVVAEGDSIMRGLFIDTRAAQATFSALHNLWGTYPSLRLAVPATSGNTIAVMSGRYLTTTKPLYSVSRGKNILVVAAATNDFAAAGAAANASTTKNALWAYCDQAKADGFLVIPATMLPREGMVSQYETQRTAFNTAVRAEWAGRGYSALYDEAAVSGMGAFGDSANTTNYGDGTHPTAAGAALLRPALQAAIATVLAA